MESHLSTPNNHTKLSRPPPRPRIGQVEALDYIFGSLEPQAQTRHPARERDKNVPTSSQQGGILKALVPENSFLMNFLGILDVTATSAI